GTAASPRAPPGRACASAGADRGSPRPDRRTRSAAPCTTRASSDPSDPAGTAPASGRLLAPRLLRVFAHRAPPFGWGELQRCTHACFLAHMGALWDSRMSSFSALTVFESGAPPALSKQVGHRPTTGGPGSSVVAWRASEHKRESDRTSLF